MSNSNRDLRIRLAAFDWLQTQVDLHGDVLARSALESGFEFDGERIHLVGPQGIFKPRQIMDAPLSITTTTKGPYADSSGPDGLLRYSYRGINPAHHENVGLRKALTDKIPLVYFYAIAPGKYLAAWPVYVVADDPDSLTFTVALDDARSVSASLMNDHAKPILRDSGDEGRREYITSVFRRRLHQRAFRIEVLRAYREQCALCRLRHEELLHAAHIIADSEPGGEPIVQNGLALCKLHHAAYDSYFLTVRPDYIVEVRAGILEEEDGPMLLHGLKGLHEKPILVPKAPSHRPDPDRLSVRYERFRDLD